MTDFKIIKLKKNLNIICFNDQLLGNGFLIPAGPLREGMSALKRVHIVIINGDKNLKFEKKLLKINDKLSIFYSKYIPVNTKKFKGKKLFAIAGIGNPENFFEIIREQNLTIEKKLAFPDHYQFKKSEILNIIKEAKKDNYQVVMTEKDYHRVKDYDLAEIDFIKVKLEISKEKEFLKKVLEIYGKTN